MIRIACLQIKYSDDESKEDRFSRVERMIDGAAGADLIVLPETWSVGWYSFDSWRESSETVNGETVSRLAEKARAVNAYLLTGSFIERVNDSLYNTTVLLDPKGQVVTKYSKIHLSNLRGVREADLLKRGEDIVTVATEIGVFGFSICYDLRFPELFRKMAIHKGVEVFIHIGAWPLVRVENWVEMCHVRAAENMCYLVACNCVGSNRGNNYLGHSMIVDPHGTAIANAGLLECILRGEVDIDYLHQFRKDIPTLGNIFLSI